MSRAFTHKRYMRQQNAEKDKQQTILSGEGIAENPHHFAVAIEPILPPESKVTCPFCLALASINRFFVSDKKGISRGKAKCPACERGMLMKSLVNMTKFTVEEYAEWVFEYPGFWKIVKYNKWSERLRMMGWTDDFWRKYNLLKEERRLSRPESYEDYMTRQAEEENQRWMDSIQQARSEGS